MRQFLDITRTRMAALGVLAEWLRGQAMAVPVVMAAMRQLLDITRTRMAALGVLAEWLRGQAMAVPAVMAAMRRSLLEITPPRLAVLAVPAAMAASMAAPAVMAEQLQVAITHPLAAMGAMGAMAASMAVLVALAAMERVLFKLVSQAQMVTTGFHSVSHLNLSGSLLPQQVTETTKKLM
jgi:hypothetical protein